MIILQEKKQKHIVFMLMAFVLLGVNFLFFTLPIDQLLVIGLLLVVYFGLFNFLEAAMPAYLSKMASEKYRGAAMGVFSSTEFLGAFVGGAMGGWLMSRSFDWVFYALAGLMLVLALISRIALKKS